MAHVKATVIQTTKDGGVSSHCSMLYMFYVLSWQKQPHIYITAVDQICLDSKHFSEVLTTVESINKKLNCALMRRDCIFWLCFLSVWYMVIPVWYDTKQGIYTHHNVGDAVDFSLCFHFTSSAILLPSYWEFGFIQWGTQTGIIISGLLGHCVTESQSVLPVLDIV